MPEYVGIAEIGAMLGWDRRNVATARSQGKLPEPDQELAMGPIWHKGRILAWMEERGHQTPSSEPMPLYERIAMAERVCKEHGLEVVMAVRPKHGDEGYSGQPVAWMADRHWTLYARDPATDRKTTLGDRFRPPSESRVRKRIERFLAAQAGVQA